MLSNWFKGVHTIPEQRKPIGDAKCFPKAAEFIHNPLENLWKCREEIKLEVRAGWEK